jgi:integrase
MKHSDSRNSQIDSPEIHRLFYGKQKANYVSWPRLPIQHLHEAGIICPACSAVEESLMPPELTPSMIVSEASNNYIALRTMNVPGDRVRYVSKQTLHDYGVFAKALNRFFGEMTLESISAAKMREYQRLRALGGDGTIKWAHPAGANLINKELGYLIRLKKLAGAWNAEIDKQFSHLQHEEPEAGRALSPPEQEHWLTISARISHFIYHYTDVALASASRTKEIRSIRLGDIDKYNHVIFIRAATSKQRQSRTVPIPDDVWPSVEWLIALANSRGSVLPQHYLFPRGRGNKYDPSLPMTVSGFKKPWAKVCEASGIYWRRADTRQTGFTRMAEAGVPIHVAMSIGGHLRREMQDHYIQICEQAKRWATEATRKKPIRPGFQQDSKKDSRGGYA